MGAARLRTGVLCLQVQLAEGLAGVAQAAMAQQTGALETGECSGSSTAAALLLGVMSQSGQPCMCKQACMHCMRQLQVHIIFSYVFYVRSMSTAVMSTAVTNKVPT